MSTSGYVQSASGMTGGSFNREWTRLRQAYCAAGYELTQKFHYRDTENTEYKNPQITQITQIL